MSNKTNKGEAPRRHPVRMLFELLGSYGLACVILLLMFLLTLVGTLEQVQSGLYVVQKRYFESLFVIHKVAGVVPIPLPGVMLLMIMLTINLILGGFVRIRKSKQTIGILIVHSGILLLMFAGLVKLGWSDDGHLTLYEGEKSARYISYHELELAIYDAQAAKNVREHLIPDSNFKHLTGDLDQGASSARFTGGDLPFDLTLSHFVLNGRPMPKGPMWTAKYPVVNGFAVKEEERNKEAELNTSALYVTVHPKDGSPATQGIVWALEIPYDSRWGNFRYAGPFLVRVGGKLWAIDLRKKRFDLPFEVRLDKFTHELIPGTSMPKVFLSDITKYEGGSDSQHKIQMNEPLRHDGFVLFQSSWGPPPGVPNPKGQLFSGFSVVNNPSDYWPLYSCIIIGVGLIIAFSDKLYRYVRSQAPKRKRELEPDVLEALGLKVEVKA